MFPRPSLAVVLGVLAGGALAVGAYLALSSTGDAGQVRTTHPPQAAATVVVEQVPGPATGTPSAAPTTAPSRTARTTRTATPAARTTTPARTRTPSAAPTTSAAPTSVVTVPTTVPTTIPRPTHSDD